MSNILYRETLTPTIPGSSSVKGLGLTNAEIDGNFKSLNDTKIEISDAVSTNTADKVVKRDSSGNFSAGTITAALSGNATTATRLAASVTINGTSFNGSSNITITANTTNTLTRGSYLTGNNFNGSAATTWAVDATSSSTASKVVARDSSGNFSANIITVVDINSTSDRNLKNNIENITESINILNQLQGVSFNWNSNNNKSYGIIAQELQKVLPELVHESDEGFLTVNYIPLIAFLIEAIKTQQTQISDLQSRVL